MLAPRKQRGGPQTLRLLAVTATARRLDDEDIVGIHLRLMPRAEHFALCFPNSLDPVHTGRTRLAACESERCDTAPVGQDHRGHRREETYAPLGAIAARMQSRTAAAAPDPEVI